jgi:hypothetical protein
MRPGELDKALHTGLVAGVAEELRERIGAIRDPATGNFPTVIVRGQSLDDMHLVVEGDPAVLERVSEALSPEEEAMVQINQRVDEPRVFLSWASEDRTVAEVVARHLMANGIDTWWSEWEMRSGDSLRRKIEKGLSSCTHFIVLLTPTSITKPWVNEEIDAGFVRHVEGASRFIPVRHELDVAELSPLLKTRIAPKIGAESAGLDALVGEIFGLSKKPVVGLKPAALNTPLSKYSPAAMAAAKLLVETSEHAEDFHPQLTLEELAQKTGLSREDAEDAVYELRHFLRTELQDRIAPSRNLFAEFDQHWKSWTPSQDALYLAADLVNDPTLPSEVAILAERYGWPARRMNPAISFLDERDALSIETSMGCAPFVVSRIKATQKTRRFVRSRS